MVLPPLTFSDISLLLAIGAIALLLLLEVTSPFLGRINFVVDRKKVRVVALLLGALFIVAFIVTTYGMIAGP